MLWTAREAQITPENRPQKESVPEYVRLSVSVRIQGQARTPSQIC